MTDPHQINALIAAAILDCRKAYPDGIIGSEEGKMIAKCIVQHLTDAGFSIVRTDTLDEASARP